MNAGAGGWTRIGKPLAWGNLILAIVLEFQTLCFCATPATGPSDQTVPTPSLGPTTPSTQPVPKDLDVAALVLKLKADESWVDKSQSLNLTLSDTWIRPADSIARDKAKLQNMFRGQPAATNPSNFLGDNFKRQLDGTLDLAFDEHRVYSKAVKFDSDSPLRVRVWDGKLGFDHEHDPGQPDGYALFGNIDRLGGYILGELPWPQMWSHQLWFSRPEGFVGDKDRCFGRPEDYNLIGREVFRAHDCLVIARETGMRRTLYVDSETHRLMGIKTPIVTDWYENYSEIAPGCWLPMFMGYDIYEMDGGPRSIQVERQLMVLTVARNQPLPDDVFKFDVPEGVRVVDARYYPAIVYDNKHDMPAVEIDKLLADARQRMQESLANSPENLNRLNRPATALPKEHWLNSAAMSLADFKGKPVILYFWAEWCDACKEDFLPAAKISQDRQKSGIEIVGVHTPGSSDDAIGKAMADNHLSFPICVDERPLPGMSYAWGTVHSAYDIHAVPEAALIDPSGVFVAHGSLADMYDQAKQLAATTEPASH